VLRPSVCTAGAVLACLLVLAAPADAALSPAAVVRAWSAAVNRGDNEAAAKLFATNATVAQGGYILRLKTHRLAVLWNKGLPCGASILTITVDRKRGAADATFLLRNRSPVQLCDAPGIRARAAFTVRRGKIVAWVQLPVAPPKKKPGDLKA
jgi:limonene-1,2-epoxide hydrolase